jgi:predicted small secreted protein
MKSFIGAATAAALAAITLSGCGTITQGTSQDIAITTSPPGGHCELDRHGEHIGTIYSAPGQVHVDKTKYDIDVTCTKPGYQMANLTLESGYGIGVFGNAIIGGAIGWGIDSATGADNKYPNSALVPLAPMEPGTVSATQLQARSLCTPEDRAVAQLAAENHYSVQLNCD